MKQIGFLLLSIILLGTICLTSCRPSEKEPSDSATSVSSAADSSVDVGTTEASRNGETVSTDVSSGGSTGMPSLSPVTGTVSVKTLDMRAAAVKSVPERAVSSSSRLLVNRDNPLFMFYPPMADGKTPGESCWLFWKAIPEDIRKYSALFISYPQDNMSDNAVALNYLDEILKVADQNNIPIIFQIEDWHSDQYRKAFTPEELGKLLSSHPSLVGFSVSELSCCGFSDEELARLKRHVTLCKKYKALFIWRDMEYPETRNTFAHFLEDKAFYDLMSGYAYNTVIMDKHNGHGRHFSVQSAAMGCWLSGACGNWGSNVESWLWWEEGLSNYDEIGGLCREFSNAYTYQYPASMTGIDMLNDMAGGATVYCFEQIPMYMFVDGTMTFSPAFYNVLYPLYQRMLAEKIIPSKQQVADTVKVAYQYGDLNTTVLQGNESALLVDLYASTTEEQARYAGMGGITKKWIPTTGRYYIVPFLLKYADAASLYPHMTVLNDTNYASLAGTTTASKQSFFNGKYAETYTGTATMYSINGLSYIFNHHEYQVTNAHVNADFSIKAAGKGMSIDLPAHSYILLKDQTSTLSLELYNYRYDFRRYMNKKERVDMFVDALYDGQRDGNELDFRTTTLTLRGLKAKPAFELSGNNNASADYTWDAAGGVFTLRITSNGVARLTLQGLG